MAFVSITRLRIRAVRFMPSFLLLAFRSRRQVRTAEGFRGGSLLADRQRTFWTMTIWDDQAAMRHYMTSGSHKVAMSKLLDWCDEASIVHWEDASGLLPSWQDATERMRSGRASKVRNPSPNHADLSYDQPRLGGGVPIKAKRGVA